MENDQRAGSKPVGRENRPVGAGECSKPVGRAGGFVKYSVHFRNRETTGIQVGNSHGERPVGARELSKPVGRAVPTQRIKTTPSKLGSGGNRMVTSTGSHKVEEMSNQVSELKLTVEGLRKGTRLLLWETSILKLFVRNQNKKRRIY
ncbi:uncharacterized protein LOC143251767 [Tachypleus tridentatus]|uniref:uncharacterized protein LOC143251767 n=1 Tax=Tachypleus tridentatus TaxID=6853 RepID=UPI003FD057BC